MADRHALLVGSPQQMQLPRLSVRSTGFTVSSHGATPFQGDRFMADSTGSPHLLEGQGQGRSKRPEGLESRDNFLLFYSTPSLPSSSLVSFPCSLFFSCPGLLPSLAGSAFFVISSPSTLAFFPPTFLLSPTLVLGTKRELVTFGVPWAEDSRPGGMVALGVSPSPSDFSSLCRALGRGRT